MRPDREIWLREAVEAELASSLVTCRAIVKASMLVDIDPQADREERRANWQREADEMIELQALETARAVLFNALVLLRGDVALWMRAVELERTHGSIASQCSLLRRATEDCSEQVVFHLMLAKHAWKAEGSVEVARHVLEKGLEAAGPSEELYLALTKLEREEGRWEDARRVLARGREECKDRGRVWMQSI